MTLVIFSVKVLIFVAMFLQYITAFFLFCFPGFMFSQENIWKRFQHDSLAFIVMAPDDLTPVYKTSLTELGEQPIVSFGLKPQNKKDPNLLYQIIVIQYPQNILSADSTELISTVLNKLAEDSVEEGRAELIYKESNRYYGRQGIQWRIHFGNDISIKSRAVTFNDRIYIAQVMSPTGHSLNENIDRFLDSFRFI